MRKHVVLNLISPALMSFILVPLLAVIALVWIAILIDQMPCFMGVPNCD